MSPNGTSTGSDTRSRTIRAVAVLNDLFFVARIRETARLAGATVAFARTVMDLERELGDRPDLVLLDLTSEERDYEAVFAAIAQATPRVPVLGITTHVLARRTQPMHARCDRVVTRETLTRELGSILTKGLACRDATI